jgi:hypothetical protein
MNRVKNLLEIQLAPLYQGWSSPCAATTRFHLLVQGCALGQARRAMEAGAVTRPLFSSSLAVSYTKYTLNTLLYPSTPFEDPLHVLSSPCMYPLSSRKRLS